MKKAFNIFNIITNVTKLYKKNKNLFFASVICFVMIVFLSVSSLSSLKTKKQDNISIDSSVSITEYAEKIEKKISGIVSKIDKVKSVSAFVMVEATPKIDYLTEKKETTITNEDGSKTEITTTVVFEKNGSSNKPVVVATIMPKITGVLIITNKINSSTKLSIINSLSIVLNIEESCISILQES